MRMLLNSMVVLLLATAAYAQKASVPKCELEQLAIVAALGDPVAQYNLGVEFFSGDKVPRDFGKAASMWRKASDAGDVAASNNLGFLKYYGRPGVARDYAEGIRLWRFAAERGFAESQVHLGQAYSDGRFLKSDFIEAYAWAKTGKHYSSKVSEKINEPQIADEIAKDAEKVLVEMRTRLNTLELREAEKKAALYIRNFVPR